MSSVNDLINLAEYDRQVNESTNPLFALARGVNQGIIEDAEQRRLRENTKTTFAKLQQILGGESADYQNKYKLKPTFDSKTGSIGASLGTKSDSERFSEAVRSGRNPYQLRLSFPQFADQIDKLEISGVFNQGASISPAAQGIDRGTAIPGAVDKSIGTKTINVGNKEFSYVPEIDALNRVSGHKLVETGEDLQDKKFRMELAEREQLQAKQSQLVRKTAEETLGTIDEIEKGKEFFGLRSLVPAIPGTEKANWEANINKLLADKVLSVMSELKQASRTGATGFGQLSEKELRLLQDASTALKKNLSQEDAQRYLDQMRDPLKKILGDNSGKEFQQTQSGLKFRVYE